MSPHSSACVICGNDVVAEVAMGLVEWREPVGRETWSTIPRCKDRDACRSRVETVLREPWPIADGTPASVIPPEHPEPEAEHPPANVEEEVVPWLR